MSGWEMKIIVAEAHRLLELAAEDADLRADLRALAQEILAATEAPRSRTDAVPERSPSGTVPAPAVAGEEPDSPSTHDACRVDRPQEPEPLRELTLGRRTTSPIQAPLSPDMPTRPEPAEDELIRIEARCRAKAEAAHRAAERQRRIREGTDFPVGNVPIHPEFAEWADRLMDDFYWRDASQPADLSSLDDVAGCFEAVAEALSLVQRNRDEKGLERALPLVAQAQSALRAAIQRFQAPVDPDQLAVYAWLRETAARHRIYLKRYMRADDLADPNRWSDLLARIGRADPGHGQAGRRSRNELLIDQLRSHLNVIREGKDTEQGWRAAIEAVDAMVGEGVPPSSRAIRELLLPVIDDLPDRDDWPQGFRLVLREIDRYLAGHAPVPETTAPDVPSAEVAEAARLLSAKGVVLIGGSRRPGAYEALKGRLGLKELVWIETREHESIERFEPYVARPEVVLVLLAIRWSSHSFGDVRRLCDRYGKPMVRLPGGYSPNQVAAQILAQCSGQLGDKRDD